MSFSFSQAGIFLVFVCACLCKPFASHIVCIFTHLIMWKNFPYCVKKLAICKKELSCVTFENSGVLAVLLLNKRHVFSLPLLHDDRVLGYLYVIIAHPCVLPVYQKSSGTLNAWLRTHSCLTGCEQSILVFTKQFVFC